MTRYRLLSLALVLLCSGVAAAAENPADPGPTLTFIDVRVEMRGHGASVLRQWTEAAREHSSLVLQEIARPERFAALERKTVPTTAGVLTRGLIEDLIAPPDQRFTRELDDVSTSVSTRGDVRETLYIITNLDIVASNLTRAESALRDLASATRESAGNVSIEILTQLNHADHFILISTWTGEMAFRAFAAGVSAQQFRKTIAPLLVSPYDERLFRRVD